MANIDKLLVHACVVLPLVAACSSEPITNAQALPDASIDAEPESFPDGAGGSQQMLGTVTPVAGTCAAGPLANTTCQLVDVACPGIATMRAAIRVTAPTGAVAGTVVFGTGTGGVNFYDGTPIAATMLGQLATAGYRIVQRSWQQAPDGWVTGPGGMRALSCRYATLASWIYNDVHGASTTTGYCASGNSGGATEIAYALAVWGLDFIDLAVPSSGPPMGRMDRGCLDGSDPTWLAECAALVPAGKSSCSSLSCSYASAGQDLIDAAWNPAAHCAQHDASFRSTFLAESVAAPGTRTNYPNTKIDFVFGANDCSESVPLGLAYATTITSPTQVTFAPNTPHAVFSTVEGAQAIRDAIIADCVPR